AEIERMKKDAEAHAEEDKRQKERVEHQNLAETMIYTAEKMLNDAGDKVTADERKEVEEKIAALKAVKDSDDHEAIKRASGELSAAAQKVGAKMYQSGTAQQDQKPEKQDEPVDAEFTEKEG
ncbi:molecular chaperone DnaK, partial [Candidatus Parcubacteria bacterium]|nr:molecular chaperone DnaK [Candidatus Parcubacteria bacterium]